MRPCARASPARAGAGASRELGQERRQVAVADLQRAQAAAVEELAERQQVGAVGLERVARKAALELQVGEEVEHKLLDPRRAGRAVRSAPSSPLKLRACGEGSLPRATRRSGAGGLAAHALCAASSASTAPPASAAAKNSGSSVRLRPIVSAGRPPAAYAGRSTAARRQSWRVMRAGRSTSRADARRLPRPAPKTAPQARAQLGAHGRAHPGRQRDGDRLEQQVQHREGVMGDAAMARARDRPMTCAPRAASSSRARGDAWAESSADMPPCPSGEPDPTIPGPGPHTAASQPSVRSPW